MGGTHVKSIFNFRVRIPSEQLGRRRRLGGCRGKDILPPLGIGLEVLEGLEGLETMGASTRLEARGLGGFRRAFSENQISIKRRPNANQTNIEQ